MVTLDLLKPIHLSNGQEISQLQCDYDALTTADFRAAQKIKALVTDQKTVDPSKLSGMLRLDAEFQIAVGFVAACKATEGLTQIDFLKLSMLDAMLLGEQTSDYFFQ